MEDFFDEVCHLDANKVGNSTAKSDLFWPIKNFFRSRELSVEQLLELPRAWSTIAESVAEVDQWDCCVSFVIDKRFEDVDCISDSPGFGDLIRNEVVFAIEGEHIWTLDGGWERCFGCCGTL